MLQISSKKLRSFILLSARIHKRDSNILVTYISLFHTHRNLLPNKLQLPYALSLFTKQDPLRAPEAYSVILELHSAAK